MGVSMGVCCVGSCVVSVDGSGGMCGDISWYLRGDFCGESCGESCADCCCTDCCC